MQRRTLFAATGCSLLAGAGMAWAVRGRSSQVFGESVYRGGRSRRAIAITFDDGPSTSTPLLLNLLAKYGVSATFFQCGVNVVRAPGISQEVTAAGHEIGNHSQTHANLALHGPSRILAEFARTQEVITETTGIAPALLRPPYGVRWFGFREAQRALGLKCIMWSVIGLDWKLPAAAIAARVIKATRSGSIICLHDGRGTLEDPDVSSTIEAVRRIVPALLEKGYHFETVSELLWPTTN